MRSGLVVALVALAVTAGARAEVAAPETTEVFLGTPSEKAVLLFAHRFLLAGEEVVRREGVGLAAEIDYRLDADAGSIALKRPLAEGERLEVTYRWVPVEIPRDFVGLDRGEPTPADSLIMSDDGTGRAESIARAIDQDLSISGAKTVSIEAGTNKDAAVEQSLRVAVSGRVGESVRITALLSDQNIPLQPEGNTERLEDLDEVLVKIEGPRGSATLGDFPARRERTAFGNFERRLSGAEARVNAVGFRARGIGAAARGNFRTVEFRGEEGKQGPYLLAGSGANVTGVIVAGSERIWRDGQLLKRGRDRDYVMDYARGELEFTTRTLVTQDSRLAADFEIAEQPYRRSLLLGEGGRGDRDGAFEWNVAVASEVDDEDPLSFTMTQERREALENAGDEPVLVSGAVCGVEDGDYAPEDDHFVWVGADSGSCEVTFVFVGELQGDYSAQRDADTGALYFQYVGANAGDYAEGLLLTAPRAHLLADARISANGVAGLSLEAEGAYSEEDLNRLSTVTSPSEGGGGRALLSWESPELGDVGGAVRLRSSLLARGQQKDFVPLGRNRGAWLREVWNFTDTTRADEGLGEASFVLEGGERWNATGTYGVLDRQDVFRSERTEAGVQWRGTRVQRASWHHDSVTREDRADSLGTVFGDLRRERGELGLRLGFLEPGGTYYRDDREDVRDGVSLSGRDEEEFAALLGVEPGGGLRADLRWANRTRDVVDGGAWVRDNVGRTYEVRAEYAPRRALRARVSWTRREVDFSAGRPGQDSQSDLARTDLSHENFGGILRGEYTYETTSRSFTSLVANPDAPSIPSLALDVSARIRLGGRPRGRSPEGPSAAARFFSKFSSETVVQIAEETTRPDSAPVYLLDFRAFQSDEFTVFGRILTREEITLFPGAGPFQLTGRWERIEAADNRAAPRQLDLLTERFILRARNALGPRWTLETQGTVQDDGRSDQGVEEFDIRLLELRAELVWQPVPSTRINGGGAVVDESNATTFASVRGVQVRTEASTSVWSNGRLRTEVSWTHPTDSVGFDFGGRFRTKDTDQLEWRANLDLKLNQWVNVSLGYSGRSIQGIPTTHLARAEARALF